MRLFSYHNLEDVSDGSTKMLPFGYSYSRPLSIITDFGYRKSITIDNANVDADLTDFPVCVRIIADSDIGLHTLVTGYDVMFTDSAGTPIPYEQESWSGGGGSAVTAVFWVKVPTVYTGTTTTIYLYYGNDGDTGGQDARNTWDAYFKAIWHFKEASGTIYDSTQNSIHSIAASGLTYGEAGKAALALDINGTGENSNGGYVQWANNSVLSPGSENFTISVWAKSSDIDVSWGVIFAEYGVVTNNFVDLSQLGTGWRTTFRDAGGDAAAVVSGTVDTDWHHIVGVRSGTTALLYIDGSLADSNDNPALGSVDVDSGTNPTIGYPTFPATYSFPGHIDELRISKGIARSEEWTKFEYHNMNEADSELTYGTQEPPEAGGSAGHQIRVGRRAGIGGGHGARR